MSPVVPAPWALTKDARFLSSSKLMACPRGAAGQASLATWTPNRIWPLHSRGGAAALLQHAASWTAQWRALRQRGLQQTAANPGTTRGNAAEGVCTTAPEQGAVGCKRLGGVVARVCQEAGVVGHNVQPVNLQAHGCTRGRGGGSMCRGKHSTALEPRGFQCQVILYCSRPPNQARNDLTRPPTRRSMFTATPV